MNQIDTDITPNWRRAPLLLLLLFTAVSNGVHAAETALLEEVVVTGTRLSRESAQPTSFVLDRQALVARSPLSVVDALQMVPGVYVSQPGGRGGVPSISLRGAESNFVVVLVDGVQVNDPTNTRGGSFDFTTVDISEVHRIEIVRGAAGAVYGSDALAGVVNILTYDEAEPGTEVSLMAGEDTVRSAALRSTVVDQKLGVLNVAASVLEDHTPAADARFKSSNLRLNYDNDWDRQALSIRIAHADGEQRAFPEDSGGSLYAVLPQRDQRESDSLSIALNHSLALSQTLSLRSEASFYEKDEDFVSPGIAGGPRNPFGVPANASDSSFERTRVGTYLSSRQDSVDWVAGVQWQREDGDADGSVQFIGPTYFELQRDTASAFVELFTRPIAQLSLSAGLRSDKADGEGTQTSYRGSAQYQFNTRLAGFLRSGTGFKLPSFFALGNPLVGNPSLKPETVTSYEAGFNLQLLPQLEIELAGFRSEYEDLIDFDPVLFTNVNRSEVTTQGWELSVRGTALEQQLSYDLFVSYVDIDLPDGGRLRQRPQWRIGGSAAFALTDDVDLSLTWHYNDERFDSSIPNPSVTLDSYARVDLAAHWRLSPNLRMLLAIDNVADENYSDADGFPAPGRRARVGLTLRF